MITANTDFSIISLFLHADIIVQAVIIGLLLASIWSWAIIIEKIFVFIRIKQRIQRFENNFWQVKSLNEFFMTIKNTPTIAHESVFVAAMTEWKRSHEIGPSTLRSLNDRIDRVIDVAISYESQRMEKRLLFLASVGSSAPFIGLFGTVWGIMNAFQAIATSNNTSLAVVAPGIAEALFATAIGLLAAIPSVIAYNKFSNDAGQISAQMEGFGDEFSAILSRQIDEKV